MLIFCEHPHFLQMGMFFVLISCIIEEKMYRLFPWGRRTDWEERPMLRDLAKQYYLEQDYNCAEAILRAANDMYELHIDKEAMKLVSGFGAGMGCGHTCGALCGSIAAVSKYLVEGRAHATEGFREDCGRLTEAFEQQLGSLLCEQLKARYKKEDVRCLETVERAADVLEQYMKELEQQ